MYSPCVCGGALGRNVKCLTTVSQQQHSSLLFICLRYNCPVNIIKVMSSRSVNVLHCSCAGLASNWQPPFLNQGENGLRNYLNLVMRKPIFGGNRVRHKPACSALVASSLEILDLASRGIVSRQRPTKELSDRTAQMCRLVFAFVVRI